MAGKKFSLIEVILSVICVVFTIEAAAPASAMGNVQFFWWIFLIITFLLPYGLVVAELGTAFDSEGGLYDWVRLGLGDRWGARCSWCYWVNFPLWVASIACMFPSVITAVWGFEFSLGLRIVIELAFVWGVTVMAMQSVAEADWVMDGGAVIKVLITAVVGIVGIWFACNNGFANDMSLKTFIPDLGDTNSLTYLSIILFNFMGFEVITTYVGSMENPNKQIPRAIIAGGIAIAALYLFSSFGIGAAIPAMDISLDSGIMDAVGIMAGVGSVLSFLPTIVTLFFFLSILEDTGYMARVAFVMDQLLRRIGLSGRSFVPMLIGFGCSVPAIMATRTLSSDRDRKMTILLTPFMSCSAKLPIYALFTTAFFPRQWRAVVMIGLYITGILCGILYAILLKFTKYKGEPVPFVMELPNYRLPGLKNVAQLLWEKARDFLQKAFTVIFAATIVIWFLQNFDLQLRLTADPQASILARIAGDIAPLFGPLGFADWRISTALITGFMAKESVVSSLLILFGSEAALSAALTPAQAAPLLVFCLLYTPCVAAIASVRRELGGRWALGMVFGQLAVAWAAAFAG